MLKTDRAQDRASGPSDLQPSKPWPGRPAPRRGQEGAPSQKSVRRSQVDAREDALKGLVDSSGPAAPGPGSPSASARAATRPSSSTGAAAASAKEPIKERRAGPTAAGPKPELRQGQTAAGRVCYVSKKQRGYFAATQYLYFNLARWRDAARRVYESRGEPSARPASARPHECARLAASHGTTLSFDAGRDGRQGQQGGRRLRAQVLRRPHAPGQDALLDSAPPSDSLAQAFSTNPAAIRARKAREESRAQHGPPVKGPQAPAITGRVRVVATTNAASPGVAALHNGRTGVVTKRAAGWIEVQLDATRDKPSETIPCRKRDLVKVDEAGRALETPQGPAPALKRKPKKEWAERARREAGMRGEVEEEEEEAPRVVQRVKPAKKKDGGPPLTTAEKAAVLHAIAQL